MIRIVLIEDDTDIREGLCELLQSRDDLELLTAEESVEDLLSKPELIAETDIALMDIGLPGMSGIQGIIELKNLKPDIEVIMITMFNDTVRVFDSLRAGASGYFLKNTSFEDICDAIFTVARGGAGMSPEIARKVIRFFGSTTVKPQKHHLTEKELAVVQALVDGLSYKLIASRLEISIETVRYHIKNIYKKLQVNSKAEVISKSLRGEI